MSSAVEDTTALDPNVIMNEVATSTVTALTQHQQGGSTFHGHRWVYVSLLQHC